MKAVFVGAFASFLPVCLAAAVWDNTQQRTFQVGNSPERRLVIENISGNIKVTGDSGRDIRLTVHEHFSADTDTALTKAREEVRLEMTQEGDLVRVRLDDSFRSRDWGRDREWWKDNDRRDRRERFEFRHDYEVKVPRDLNIALKTVNGKDLTVTDVDGEFNLQNVNGSITLSGSSGYGRIRTVNGEVRVAFTRNPVRASSFETLNGTLDVTFRPDLNADLKLSTFNGEVYTDFEVTPMTLPVV
ncbi:MAG: hypothetical protein H7039_01475, partial [Bryobacteraceae bacterium]|nr:hypothetical protein [Bryobacteraceae bacterium]